VKGFRRREDGSLGPAEQNGRIRPGMAVAGVNGTSTSGMSFAALFELLRATQARPMQLRFCEDPEYELNFDAVDERPTDLRLTCFPGGYAIVTSMVPIKGPAERQCEGALEKGDIVNRINGVLVEHGTFPDIVNRLKTAPRPLRIEFAKPEGGEPCCVAEFQEGEKLGIIFFKSPDGNVAFKAFSAFPGPAKATGRVAVGHAILNINGEPVPPTTAEIEARLSQPGSLRLQMRDMALHEQAIDGLQPRG